ncbi:hypothetical protein D3C73_1305130 [compost metagenome]
MGRSIWAILLPVKGWGNSKSLPEYCTKITLGVKSKRIGYLYYAHVCTAQELGCTLKTKFIDVVIHPDIGDAFKLMVKTCPTHSHFIY